MTPHRPRSTGRWKRGSLILALASSMIWAVAPVGHATEPADSATPSGGPTPTVAADDDRGGVEVIREGDAAADATAERRARQRANATGTYLVRMAADPVATYDGDVHGLAPTRARGSAKLNPQARAVRNYAAHLREQHRASLSRVDAGHTIYDYVYAFNGYAAELTGAQATELARQAGVLGVYPDEPVQIDTASTASQLGLDADGGLWEQLGGPTGNRRDPGAGEDIVIGVIDTGIWPESASFSNRGANGRISYVDKPKEFRGKCESTGKIGDDSWRPRLCNNKIISARHFNAGWGGNDAVAQMMPWEFLSPRDYNGHGTHTASTAGGDHGVSVSGPAAIFGSITGIAPRARIAVYKALWSTEDGSTANGYPSDLVAAIDAAVADGVDVINYSVSGTSTSFADPVEIAFLNAADAGIFVAASAGNSGPDASTVAHPSPWVTTVAAATHHRSATSSVTLGDGRSYTGASVAGEAVGPAALVDGATSGLPGADPVRAAQCYPAVDNGGDPVLDPDIVAGKIVLCERGGVIARVNTSRAVAEAGGVGMILVNSVENSLNADFHSVPTVHLPDTDLPELRAYAETDGATASIATATVDTSAPAPYTAEFSSRGPLVAGNGDLLKPDLTAPGQDILAAVAPPGQGGLDFNLLSGTSMSSPHVAGLAALLMQRHPQWSPMAIKSALMTTGTDTLDGEPTEPSVIFGQGAGHVAPNAAVHPGLVYDSDAADWLAFLCGATTAVVDSVCQELEQDGYSLEPTDLNVPSIAIGLLDGTETITRTVTNVSDETSSYTASVTGLDGIDVSVQPSTLTLEAGQSATYTVTFTVDDADPFVYLGGQLSWSDGAHTVRSPVTVRARQPGDEDWSARWDGEAGQFGTSADEGTEILLHPNGQRLYVTGASVPPIPGTLVTDIMVAAYDPESGDELWSTLWDGSNGGADEPGGFGMSPDGDTLYVGGTSGGDAVVLALDGATGDIRWQARLDGPGEASDQVRGLVVAPDGSTVYVTGSANMGGNELDYLTAAYDAGTGEQKWVTYYDGAVPGTDAARAIAVSGDGGTLVVTGQSRGQDTGLTDWGTVAYDAETGEQLWDALRNGSKNGIDVGNSLAIAGDVAIVAGSVSNVDTGTDWNTIGYDLATGEQLWVSRYGATGTDVTRAVAVAPDGGTVVVTGNVEGDDSGMDYGTVAYDVSTGEQRWAAEYDGSAGGFDLAADVAFTDDGAIAVVTGESGQQVTRSDYVTIGYDMATGEQVWLAGYDATAAPDGANAVAVDRDADGTDRVFVTGVSVLSLDHEFGMDANADVGTVAYLAPFE